MAQQETEEQTSSDQPSSEEEASGRHRASGEGAADQQSGASDASDASDASTEQQSAPADASTEKQESAPSEAPTEKQRSAPSEKQQRGAADTSWAEPETQQRRHVDVGEIAWRAGNVLATVLRTLAFLFALVLVVNVVLVLVGVNPANGVAQFIGGLADLVILGFRDLFLPADPTVALIVNSLVAAVVWVFVGELLSRLVRFLAARVK